MEERYVKSIGDITENVWDVTEKSESEMTFKSTTQYDENTCSFTIKGICRTDWKIKPMSYNDFGGDYKHRAVKNIRDNNP